MTLLLLLSFVVVSGYWFSSSSYTSQHGITSIVKYTINLKNGTRLFHSNDQSRPTTWGQSGNDRNPAFKAQSKLYFAWSGCFGTRTQIWGKYFCYCKLGLRFAFFSPFFRRWNINYHCGIRKLTIIIFDQLCIAIQLCIIIVAVAIWKLQLDISLYLQTSGVAAEFWWRFWNVKNVTVVVFGLKCR